MVIWSESLDRIIPLCQEFEERLIKLLWRSRPLLNSSASSTHGVVRAPSSAGHGNESLLGVSGSVEALSGPIGNGKRNSNATLMKGLYGEQGREFDDLEKDEKDKEKVVSGHPNDNHDQKSEDGETNNITRKYKRTWYGKKVLLPPSKQGDDLEKHRVERRPIRLYAPLYNGLAAGVALGMFALEFWTRC
jgi:hypothetical protein